MAEPNPPKNGFCSKTKTFHSLRPSPPLPPLNLPLSFPSYAFSLLGNQNPTALVDSSTATRLSYSDFIQRTQTLASNLQKIVSKGDTAFILGPNSLNIPVLYFSLLSLGVIISPSNPSSTPSEISRQINLSRPVIAITTSSLAHKLPPLPRPNILLDSPDFERMVSTAPITGTRGWATTEVYQSDPAAILYSSGTTGKVKGVILTHLNLISNVAGTHAVRQQRPVPAVILAAVPLFHAYGLSYVMKAVAIGETMVLMERFEEQKALKAIEDYKVTHFAVAPPVVVAMAKGSESEPYDLSSLEAIACGGAPLGKEVIEKFMERFPKVQITQGYGLTESTGAVCRTVGPEETRRYGSSGKLSAYCEAKVVDPATGLALPPRNQGELWLRGPVIMEGYIGDEAATAETLDSDGWLRTGDLCYIDEDGFIFIVDRIKELIKYKGYQVPPAELEHLLQSHPEIIESAVIPYPDEAAGQIPMAFVVRQPQSSLDEAQVMNFVAKKVSPYKKVRRVSFVNSIPKNAAGKILRKDLTRLAVSTSPSKL